MALTDELCRSYLDLRWHFDPAAASAAGVVTQDHRLGRFDADAMRQHLAAFRAVAGAIEELEVDELQDEIDRTALLDDVRATISQFERERPQVRNPEFWLSHIFQGVYALLTRRDGDPAQRAQPTVERLEEVPAFLDAARATIRKPPAVFVDTALAMLGGGGVLLVEAARTFGAAAPELANRLNAATTEALTALKRFGTALRDEIEPDRSPRAFAIGEDLFNHRLHQEHALTAGAPELWRYGLHLKEEVEARLAEVARTIDPTSSWRDLAERLRAEAPKADELLSFYRDEVERSRQFVIERNLVSVPEGALEVTATPAFLTTLIPFAAYDAPPLELPDRTGRFYVTVPGGAEVERLLREHCVYEAPSTVVHEGYPGHHLQLLTARDLSSEVRRHLWTPLAVEGWALYVEQLMAEEGYHERPEAQLFQLVNLLWRAVRILVDIGLHTREQTPAEAVDYLVHNLPMERTNAEAEVRRYCAMPTYQLCYAVGRREILRLRDAYRARAGAEFSLRQFHDELLGYGGLPVALARWGMGLDG